MTFQNRPGGILALTLLILTANAFLHYFADNNRTHGWPSNIVRNWEQYGLSTLKGKMVKNPGGFEALSNPEVYAGHRPASLLPVFAVKRLFSWTGADMLAFHVLCSLTIGISTWFLLGKHTLAWFAGAAVLLSPGYTIYQASLDPNAIALLMTLPFAALILPQLAKPTLSVASFLYVLALTIGYSMLNWTTIFGHGMVLAYLLVAPGIRRNRLYLYMAVAGSCTVGVAALSILEKLGGGGSSQASPGILELLAGYTWGNTGYGADLSTVKAFIRLGFTGFVGMLPLLVVAACCFLSRRPKPGGIRSWLLFLPLGVGLLGVASLRNYYGHHPWMAAPMDVVGLVLSLALLFKSREVPVPEEAAKPRGFIWPTAFVLSGFVYAALVTSILRVHSGEFLALVKLVRDHTVRSDSIVLMESTDPELAKDQDTIAQYIDRHIIVVHDLTAPQLPAAHAFVLSLTESEKLPLVGMTTEPEFASWPGVRQLLDWYAKAVARRSASEAHFKPKAPYRLYQLAPTASGNP
jgi:hypothetical protein